VREGVTRREVLGGNRVSKQPYVPAGWVAAIRALVAAVEVLPVREDLLVPLFHRERGLFFFVGIELKKFEILAVGALRASQVAGQHGIERDARRQSLRRVLGQVENKENSTR